MEKDWLNTGHTREYWLAQFAGRAMQKLIPVGFLGGESCSLEIVNAASDLAYFMLERLESSHEKRAKGMADSD